MFTLRPFFFGSRSLSSSNGGRDLYDLVVVGGGMVGLALSCAIGQTPSLSNKRVLLIESSETPPTSAPPPPDRPYSNRVCSLSRGSVDLFRRLNVWSSIEAARCKEFKSLYVWDACSSAAISFTSQGLDIPAEYTESLKSHDYHTTDDAPDTAPLSDTDDVMGYVVENDVIIKALSDQLTKCGRNIEVRRGTSLSSVSQIQDEQEGGGTAPNPWLEIFLSDGSTLTTRLLVGADGAKSHVRQLTGLQSVGWKYGQSAVVATLGLEQGFSENLVAWQRFLPSGPVALLPLSNTQSSLVWSTSASHAKRLLQMSEQEFVDALNTALFDEFPRDGIVESANDVVRTLMSSFSPELVATRQYPPSVETVESSSRGMFPLSLVHAPHYVKPRVALIGDSAHQIHPLAGLGVNLGFGDVACLYQHLTTASDIGEEWGFLPRLLWYETARQQQNLPRMGVVDSLQRLFSTSFTPAVLLRSVGLQLTNAFWPAKQFIIDQAQKN